MVIIGVTGNAGGGKSAAISYLQGKGVDAVSADSINANLLKHSQSLILSIEKTLQHQLTGDDGKLRIVINDERGIHQLAIHLPGERGFGETGTDVSSDIDDRNGVFVSAL